MPEQADQQAKRKPPTRRKKIVFTLVILFGVWLAVDFALYLFLRKLGAERPVFFRAARPTSAQLDGFGKHYFHPGWGWDIDKRKMSPLGTRSARDYTAKPRYKIKAFGDSFTYGWHVEANETWTAYIEQKTGWDCLNYGVPGYGTDQALFKYTDSAIQSDYAILAIYDEDIGRIMTRYYAFYDRGKTFYVKPRFVVTKDNTISRIDTPIKRAEDLPQLRDPDVIQKLRAEDYWFQHYNRLNAPRALTWPATLMVVPHLNFFLKFGIVYLRNKMSPTYESRTAVHKYYHLYEEDSRGLRLLKHIVDTFIQTARQRGEQPIVIVFPSFDTVSITRTFARCPYASFTTYMKGLDCPFLDFGEIFTTEKSARYYLPLAGRHMSPAGNSRTADAIIELIKKLDAKRNR